MNIKILSGDKLWADTLNISLTMLGESEIEICTSIDESTESFLKQSNDQTILLIDSAISGVDYWSLVDWLRKEFAGKTIVFTEARSYNMQRSQLIKLGCHAVITKNEGLSACWSAILSFRQGEKYYTLDKGSPFDQLNGLEQKFAKDLLSYDIKMLVSIYDITQQGVNKKKLSLYQKLNIKTVHPDITFKQLATLHKF